MVVAVLFATLAHVHTKFQVVPVSWSTSPLSTVERSSDKVGISAARSGSPENMVVAVLFATLAHVHTKFQVVPVSWPTSPHSRVERSSDEVGTSAARSGSPENMVVAVLFATLAHMHTKFQVVPVSWPTSPLSRVEHHRTKLAPVPLGRAAPKTWS